MADWSKWPLSLIPSNVRGDDGEVAFNVDHDGILHVTHRPRGEEWTSLTFRLVQVEQTWVEVEEP